MIAYIACNELAYIVCNIVRTGPNLLGVDSSGATRIPSQTSGPAAEWLLARWFYSLSLLFSLRHIGLRPLVARHNTCSNRERTGDVNSSHSRTSPRLSPSLAARAGNSIAFSRQESSSSCPRGRPANRSTMCAIAPFHLPGLAGVVAPRAAAPFLHARSTAATTYGYDDDDDDQQPMSTAEFLGLSRPDHHHSVADFDLEAILRGIRSIRVPAAAEFAPVHVDSVVSRAFPRHAATAAATVNPSRRDKDPMERPSTDYLSRTQAGAMMMSDRAELIEKMHRFSTSYELAPGALHRAVSYVDRFLSAKKITGGDRHGQLLLLGATAVFAAAKYEDRNTSWRINADAVAFYAGTTRLEVLDTERELVAVLGYRLSGPTAYTFVEHFTRHVGEDDDGEATRSLAHRLANLALLDYRCLGILPSAVAASAIIMAKLTLNPAAAWREDLAAMGYAVEDLAECMDAIKEMHGLQEVWPGCAQMMEGFAAGEEGSCNAIFLVETC
ncbi:hypothetical protein HU200_038867 [Digitaria exilis]|uniref:Cyclin N-terminal domain-containing protein n=1 Tax=Digitaria exilis TaxID=1010633 RepID=A0A835BAX9_9POAL|nr:hypothetical protein HU200_038867 [Digitaria exilis]